MNRLGITAARLLRRRAPAEPSRPAVQTYRDQPGHLADAGGAYLLLPYGLLNTLTDDRQQHLVDILTELATTNSRWASTTTYQVLPWARIRPADLTDEELTWHGITSDVDPTSGKVAYRRAAAPLHPDTVVGHRPAADLIPAPPGTYPGARPPLLPAGPGSNAPATAPVASTGLRTERAKRILETHRRRELLARHAPTADTQWTEAIIAADPLWGPEQDWKILIDRSTTEASTPTPAGASDHFAVDEAAGPPAATATHDTETGHAGPGDHDAELAALEADLQDLYRP
jgi:hypothetical protein